MKFSALLRTCQLENGERQFLFNDNICLALRTSGPNFPERVCPSVTHGMVHGADNPAAVSLP